MVYLLICPYTKFTPTVGNQHLQRPEGKPIMGGKLLQDGGDASCNGSTCFGKADVFLAEPSPEQ